MKFQRFGLLFGRKVSKERLLADYRPAIAARSSSHPHIPDDYADARSLIRQRREIERTADDLLRDSTDYKCVRRIPGIKPINTLTTIAEAGGL